MKPDHLKVVLKDAAVGRGQETSPVTFIWILSGANLYISNHIERKSSRFHAGHLFVLKINCSGSLCSFKAFV